MASEQKMAMVAEIKDRITESDGMILVDYRGLSVKEMQELRGGIREAGGELKIYKNRLTMIGLMELAMPTMDEYLVGPTAFVFISEDPVAPAKAIVDFAKQHKALEIKAAYLDNAIVDAAEVKAIAALPSREELIAKLMGTLLNPVRNFMSMANAPAGALTHVMKAVADQKAAA